MDSLHADVVVQMDADFSHDPEDAGRLLARVATDADVAIGSRYVAGGAVDETLGLPAPPALAVGQPAGALDCRAEGRARLHRRLQGHSHRRAA